MAAALILGSALYACESDQGPVTEQPINGSWDLEGFFALDVRGFVQCRFSGTLDVEQLPGGVNTVVGDGTFTFDCEVDGVEQDLIEQTWTLENSRYEGNRLSMTWGECGLGARYVSTRPDVMTGGVAFCRLSFFETGVIDVAGTWEATRSVSE